MKGLNLSNFQKIKTDAKSTTLKHPMGHKIVVAHKSLSDKMKKDLNDLPFAEGGNVDKSPSIDPSKIGGDVTTSGDPIVESVSKFFSGDKKAKGGKVQKYDGGGYVDTIDSGDPIYQKLKRKPEDSDIHEGEGYSSTSLSHPTPANSKDEAYKKSVAAFNSQMAQPKAKGGMIEHCRCDETVGDNPNCTQHKNKAIRKYAEGTDEVKDIDLGGEPTVEAIDPNSAEAQPMSRAQAVPMHKPAMEQAVAESDMPQAAESPAPEQQAAPEAMQTTDAQGNGIDPTLAPNGMPVAPAPQPPSLHQELANEDKAWQNDLYNGHIKPETYHSLFEKKSTLGKIGTVFGLLLGGAGAGLTHTKNPILEIMQNEINNDLEAQKNSKVNAQNFLKLNQQNLMNNAQIEQLVKSGKLTEQQAKSMAVDTSIKATALAHTQMNWAAFHDLTKKVEAMAPGTPQRAAAEQQLSMLSQQVSNENYNIMDRASAASALSKSFNSTDSNADPEQSFQAQNRALRLGGQAAFADDREAKHIPGVPGQASRPIPEGIRNEVQAMSVLDNKGKDVLDFVKEHKGTWNPQTRAVAAQKIEEMKNFYNDSIKGGALTQGRLGWYDEQFAKHPTDILAQIMGSSSKLQEMVNSNANRREMILSGPGGLGFNKPAGSKSNNTTGGISKSGRQMIQRDGKWYYK